MIPVAIRRVFMAGHRVDFRKRLNGLLGEAYRLGADPYDGDCVLFVKKDHTQLRTLVGAGVGLYLVTRRFEGGRLRTLLKFSELQPGARSRPGSCLFCSRAPPSRYTSERVAAWSTDLGTELKKELTRRSGYDLRIKVDRSRLDQLP